MNCDLCGKRESIKVLKDDDGLKLNVCDSCLENEFGNENIELEY